MRLPTVDLQGRGFEAGKKQAIKEAAIIVGRGMGFPPEQVFHYLNNEGQCECDFDREMMYSCDNFERNRELYFRELYNMTREEYVRLETAEQNRRNALRIQEALEAQAEARKKIEDKAREQGIDPKFLP